MTSPRLHKLASACGTILGNCEGKARASNQRVVREGNWREDARAGAWVGKPIARVLGVDAEDDAAMIKAALKKLIKDGVLKCVQGKDNRRHDVMFVVVV